ncbi:MAG: EFR1 family ferrodoxin [Desulfobacterales bacterium]|nr:EFR1 family ferrodoxin [Desulfobacterales bacterium]
MKVNSVSCVSFSPTGTTKAIIEHIAKGMAPDHIEMMDCTNRSQREEKPFSFASDMVIMGTPVYYGRVPEEVVPFLNTLEAQNTPVVLIVVYGNREYEDALIELHDISVSQGFVPVAGGAFIAEHSYSLPSRPIAHGRPDETDIEDATAFGVQVKEKLNAATTLEAVENITIQGNRPYVEPKNLHMIKQVREQLAFTPETDENTCIQCGQCADICPTNAIDAADFSKINRWQCMICFACIKNCPSQAKQMTDPHFNGAIKQLQAACRERKEPEIFI